MQPQHFWHAEVHGEWKPQVYIYDASFQWNNMSEAKKCTVQYETSVLCVILQHLRLKEEMAAV